MPMRSSPGGLIFCHHGRYSQHSRIGRRPTFRTVLFCGCRILYVSAVSSWIPLSSISAEVVEMAGRRRDGRQETEWSGGDGMADLCREEIVSILKRHLVGKIPVSDRRDHPCCACIRDSPMPVHKLSSKLAASDRCCRSPACHDDRRSRQGHLPQHLQCNRNYRGQYLPRVPQSDPCGLPLMSSGIPSGASRCPAGRDRPDRSGCSNRSPVRVPLSES